MSERESSFVQGTRLGRYELLEHLGAGAMGEVYLGLDRTLNRRVAIKVLGAEHLSRADLRARFAREARAVAAISHPNVVQIFDIQEHDGRPYFVMEYLKGMDLGALLERRPLLPAAEAVAIGVSAALGLAEAAAAGVVHRDVKPANLVLTDRGMVKVTDFGLAKGALLGADLTGSGVTLGTPDYMSPEQARGEKVDARVDVYGLGCTLFHLLSGRPPYRGTGERVAYPEVVARHIRNPVPALAEEVPGLDPALCDLVARMMSKKPEARPDYAEVIAVLQDAAARLGARLPHLTLPATAHDSRPTAKAAAAEGPASSDGLRIPFTIPRWTLVLTGVSLVAFVVALGLYLLLGPPSRPPAPPPLPPIPKPLAPDPGAPEGMIRLSIPGAGRIAVAILPVTVQQVERIAPELRRDVRPSGKIAAGLSLQAARLLTQKLGGRLPTSDEWPHIERSGQALIMPQSCEWVDDGPTPKARCFKGPRAVVRSVKLPYKNSILRVVRPLGG